MSQHNHRMNVSHKLEDHKKNRAVKTGERKVMSPLYNIVGFYSNLNTEQLLPQQ